MELGHGSNFRDLERPGKQLIYFHLQDEASTRGHWRNPVAIQGELSIYITAL